MATAPQFTLNRTCSVTVPAVNPTTGDPASFYGWNLPSLDDAGEFVLAWGGFVYDSAEPGDPFYLHIVKIEKATWTVVQDAYINAIPDDPYYTCAGLTVAGSTIYAILWTWGFSVNAYVMVQIDLDTLTVVNRSNIVDGPSGSNSILSNGGNERDAYLFVRGDYIGVGAGYGSSNTSASFFTYQISTNTLSLVVDGVTGYSTPNWIVASDGTIYRIQNKIDNSGFRIDVGHIPSPSFTPLATSSSWIIRSGTANGVAALYLDEANSAIYSSVLEAVTFAAGGYIKISTVDGSTTGVVVPPLGEGSEEAATAAFGWRGFAPVQVDETTFYFYDSNFNFTIETQIVIPADETALESGFFWDILFTGTSSPLYGSVEADPAIGEVVPFYEYLPQQVDYPGGDGILGYTEPEDAGVGLYKAIDGFTASAVEHKSDTSVDNLDVTHFLDTGVISEADLRAGIYDFATVEVRVVNYAAPSHGCLKLLKGELGRVSLKNGLAQSELRGLTQKLSTNIGSTFGPVCRAELFSGAVGFTDYDPGSHWKCRKDPTNFNFNLTVASSPDGLTVIPTSAPSTPAIPTNTGVVTLNGVAVNAVFYTHRNSNDGLVELAIGGDAGVAEPEVPGTVYYFDSTTLASSAASAVGNSLLFNHTAALFALFGTGHPIMWAVLSQAGTVLSEEAPWSGALENWQMAVFGEFFVPAPGNYTFTVAHDDGCIWAVQPSVTHPADVVTVVSGHTSPPFNSSTPGVGDPLNHAKTFYNGYSFSSPGTSPTHCVAANNWSNHYTDTWTLHFPASGVYLFEFDMTNWEHASQLAVNIAGQSTIPPDNPFGGQTSGWFDNGELTFTSGVLNGQSFDIQTFDGTSFKLFAGAPLAFQPAPGDTFNVRTGCNHLIADCYFKYNNVANFQGENQMPGQLVILQTPDLP